MANTVLAKMAVQIAANTADFNRKITETNKKLGGFQKTANLVTRSLGALGLSIGVGALVKSIFDLGVRAEQTTIAFNTFLGSASKGRQILKELTEFSVATPFTPEEVNSAAKALLAFGVDGSKVTDTLKFLGDVSSGTGKNLTELAIIFGQIRSTGRLMGQDLLQLINAGFNPLQVISQKTGKSVGDLKKEMEKGLISFDQVEQAFRDATSEGGLFFNLMEKQSVTVGGKLSTLSGNVQELGKAIFGLSSGPIPFLVDGLNKLVIKATELLKLTSFDEIADVGLTRFRDRLNEVNELLSSNLDGVKNQGKELGNIFAQDIVNAINEAKKELQDLEQINEILAFQGDKNTDIYKSNADQIEILKSEIKLLNEVKDDLFKKLKGLGEETTTYTETLEKLNKKKNDLLIQFRNTDTADKKELNNIALKVKAVDAEIKAIEALLETKKKSNNLKLEIIFDPDIQGSLNPELANQIAANSAKELTDELLKVGQSAEFTGGKLVTLTDQTSTFSNAANEMINISGLVSGGIIEIADAFGQAASGSINFGDAILRSLGSFSQQFGALLIANGLATIAFKKFSGPGMIAAGAALVAIGGAIKGVIANRPNLSGSGTSGGFSSTRTIPSSNFAVAQNGVSLNLAPTTVIRGQDLFVIWKNYNENNRATRSSN